MRLNPMSTKTELNHKHNSIANLNTCQTSGLHRPIKQYMYVLDTSNDNDNDNDNDNNNNNNNNNGDGLWAQLEKIEIQLSLDLVQSTAWQKNGENPYET